MFTDPLDTVIKRFKYYDKRGWAPILGRILLGWLQANTLPSNYDIILANPGYDRDHVERILEAAKREDLFDEWGFDTGPLAVRKVSQTQRSAGRSWSEKCAAAQQHADALAIDRQRLNGRRVLLVDDVATTLLTMEMVARRLVADGGARSVSGLVLARVPYTT